MRGSKSCVETGTPLHPRTRLYVQGGTTGYGELDTAGAFDMLAGVNKFGLPLGCTVLVKRSA
eukprot:3560103-Amphidinium_carterae.2